MPALRSASCHSAWSTREKSFEVGDDLADPLEAVAGFADQLGEVGLEVIEIGGHEIRLRRPPGPAGLQSATISSL